MNREEAKNKVMTIYGSLSEDMKQAIDVLVDAIPEGATNGDVFKIMFPDMECMKVVDDSETSDWIICRHSPYPWSYEHKARFSGDWWNAPYKQEGKE